MGITPSNVVNLGTEVTGTLVETSGGTGIITYTAGDILYADGANSLTKLAKGTDGQVLTLASGVPSWAAALNAGYELVEKKSVTGSAQATLDFDTVLDGDNDGGYIMRAHILNAHATNRIFFGVRLNGALIASSTNNFAADYESAGTSASTTTPYIGDTMSGAWTVGQFTFERPASGAQRLYEVTVEAGIRSANTAVKRAGGGALTTPASGANIVSMGIQDYNSSDANLGVGTTIYLYKRVEVA